MGKKFKPYYKKQQKKSESRQHNKKNHYSKKENETTIEPRKLKFGDIVYLNIPFRENMSDFYNGHTVEDVTGSKFVDKFGRQGKARPCVVISATNESIKYIQVTHTSGSEFHLLNDSTMLKNTRDNSYVNIKRIDEFDCYNKKVKYIGKLQKKDINQIKQKLYKNSNKIQEGFDSRGLLSDHQRHNLETLLNNHGYQQYKDYDKVRYVKNREQITLYPDNVMEYHYEMRLHELKHIISHRLANTDLHLQSMQGLNRDEMIERLKESLNELDNYTKQENTKGL